MTNVIISFPQDTHIRRDKISDLVNASLNTMGKEIADWSAYVEMRSVHGGSFLLIAKCDNEEVRSKMQWMLNVSLNQSQAA